MSLLKLEGAPVPVSADFDVSFMDIDGGRRCEPLSSCWIVPFERALQGREADYRIAHNPDLPVGPLPVSALLSLHVK